MFVDILQGSQLGPYDGWFRKGKARNRFSWESTVSTYDRDKDGVIARDELPTSARDFARLDRDRDGLLTPLDFDFSAPALSPSPGAFLFSMADFDGNGKVTREEFEGLFRRLDQGDQGFLSQDELRALLTPPASRPMNPGTSTSSGPSRWTLVKGLFRQEIGSLDPGPALDEVAPDFRLKTVDGKAEVSLKELEVGKPVILIFGNFTCGPFRSMSGNIEKIYARYKDRANFLMVYVREAHPTDGWSMASNDRVGVTLRQPRSYDERVDVARRCGQALGFGFPLLVDTIDDTVGARYSGMPGRFYLIDSAGKVAYKSGRGPFGFKPAELEQALLLLLAQETPVAARPKSEPGR
jgi:Ca2+-binding EF-hand superfamily protein